MTKTQNNNDSLGRGIAVGVITSILTAIVMIVATKTGMSPFPKPPSLAFAETLLGHALPMPVGLLFHTAYVTFWAVLFVRFFPSQKLKTALALAGALWVVILLVFFPIIGWGVAGSHISPKLIPASFMPHLLFGLLIWAVNKYLPHKS